jgi:hypothetical protein
VLGERVGRVRFELGQQTRPERPDFVVTTHVRRPKLSGDRVIWSSGNLRARWSGTHWVS